MLHHIAFILTSLHFNSLQNLFFVYCFEYIQCFGWNGPPMATSSSRVSLQVCVHFLTLTFMNSWQIIHNVKSMPTMSLSLSFWDFVSFIEILHMVNHEHNEHARWRVAKGGWCFGTGISVRQSIPYIYEAVWNILCA